MVKLPKKAASDREPECCAELRADLAALRLVLQAVIDAPSGSTFTSEDGRLVAIPRPTVNSTYQDGPGVLQPYWFPAN